MTGNRGETFRALHERDQAFVIPNPFNAGTAILNPGSFGYTRDIPKKLDLGELFGET